MQQLSNIKLVQNWYKCGTGHQHSGNVKNTFPKGTWRYANSWKIAPLFVCYVFNLWRNFALCISINFNPPTYIFFFDFWFKLFVNHTNRQRFQNVNWLLESLSITNHSRCFIENSIDLKCKLDRVNHGRE